MARDYLDFVRGVAKGIKEKDIIDMLEGESVQSHEDFERWASFCFWQQILKPVIFSPYLLWFDIVLVNPITQRFVFRAVHYLPRNSPAEQWFTEVQRFADSHYYRQEIVSLSTLYVEGIVRPENRYPILLTKCEKPFLCSKIEHPFAVLTLPSGVNPPSERTKLEKPTELETSIENTARDLEQQYKLLPELLCNMRHYFDLPERIDNKKITKYFAWLLHLPNWRYYVYYPLPNLSRLTGAVVLAYNEGMSIPRIRESAEIFWDSLSALSACVGARAEGLISLTALRSAIAAIMSRNMSHNLGSHVLARTGTNSHLQIADRQTFERYLQERMDFIAQVSTEWPAGSQPILFLSGIMQWFLSQKRLLADIARSEGLTSHQYEGQQQQQEGDIRFHVFLVPESCWRSGCSVEQRMKAIKQCRSSDLQGDKYILLYTPADGTEQCCKDEDFEVAIPGGIVGQHAFFTILENIIRNAAKHGYSQRREQFDHLDVVIEAFHDPEGKVHIYDEAKGKAVPAYLFRIYTNASPVCGEKYVADVDDINRRLGSPLIREDGSLEKANWGHAEMKIAAGYLQLRDIMHIGGRGQQITGDLNTSMLDLGKIGEGSRAIIRAVQSPIGTLGYEFYIPRPRTVGIVCP